MELPTVTIRHGDCLCELPVIGEHVAELIYMDPPFNTGDRQTASASSYSDVWADMDAYLAFLKPRVEAAVNALKPNGSILLHCDWHASHHLRLMLDEILGPECFINHLIWKYGLGGSSPRRFARKHDDILFYARSENYYFKPPMIPATSNRMRGELKKATDILDIPAINNMALERSGYPTQKPLDLLRLLIDACCIEGGLVIDPFCGSGTTIVAAVQSGRKAIGIDINPDAVGITHKRLAGEFPELSMSIDTLKPTCIE